MGGQRGSHCAKVLNYRLGLSLALGCAMTLTTTEAGGWQNLEVMAEARNYNAFLVDQVAKAMAGRRRVLDFGAGRGTFALPMRERGYDVRCVEPEPTLRCELQAGGFAADASLDDVEPHSLDGIYTLNVLEHIDDDGVVLTKLCERLVEGGRLYVYVPAFQILYSGMDRLVGHVRRYRRRELVEKCRRAGFVVEQSKYCDSLGFCATLAYKAVDSGDGTINRRALVLYDRLVFPLSRALDGLVGTFVGKNVSVLATRSAPSTAADRLRA